MAVALQSIIETLAQINNEQYPEGIIVSQDIGAHKYCDINSNCPEAIKLRKYIAETGLELEFVIQEYQNMFNTLPPIIEPQFPDFSGKATIVVAGQEVEVDLSEVIEDELKRVLRRKVEWFEDAELTLKDIGKQLHQTLIRDIMAHRKNVVLPQLTFPDSDVMRYGCMITSDGSNYRIFFPFSYRPEWLWTQGIRYRLSDEDITKIQRDAFLLFTISREGKIFAPYLVNKDGTKFRHYHASRGGDDDFGGRDCWGQVNLPVKWDGTLKSLADFKYSLEGAIQTINLDSLYTNEPPGMPYAYDMQARATKVGQEGKLKGTRRQRGHGEPEEVVSETPREAASIDSIPRRWGER